MVRLRIDDSRIGGGNYEYRLCVNNSTSLLIPNNGVYEIEDIDSDEVCIIGRNMYMGGFKRFIFGVLMLLMSFLSGTSDVDMFGYPFDLKFYFKHCNDGEIIFERNVREGISIKSTGLSGFRYEIGTIKREMLRWFALAIIPITSLWLCIMAIIFMVFLNASNLKIVIGIILIFLLIYGICFFVRTFSAFKGVKRIS